MAIVRAEMLWYRARKTSDTVPAQNGGRFNDAALINSGVVGNVFDDVSEAERTAGDTSYRKIFAANRNSTGAPTSPGEVLFNPRLYVENYTPADDELFITLGTQDGVESVDIPPTRWYGIAQLQQDITGGVTNPIRVTIPNFTNVGVQPFADGDLIRISDKADVDAAGNTEFATIAGGGISAVGGDVFDLTLTAAPGNGFVAASTRVASVIDLTGDATYGNLEPSFDTFVDGSGAWDEVTYPPEVYNVGTVREAWTLEVTASGPTGLTLTGDELGVIGQVFASGGYFSFTNPAGGLYFRLDENGFTGSFGDTFTFNTNPAAIPLWCLREVPAATAAAVGNTAILVFDGETA